MLRKIRSNGLLYSIGIGVNRIVPERLFRFRVFRIYQLSQVPPAESLSPTDSIRFRWCETESDLETARQLTHFHPVRSDTTPATRACLALDGDQPVGGVWLSRGSFLESELGLTIKLRPDDYWLFAANLQKSHRRRGIYRRLLSFVLQTHGQARGDGRVFASINPLNKASIAAHRSVICQTLGTCLAGRLMRWSACCASGKLKKRCARGANAQVEVLA